jgi:signal transduction histidine kinase
MAAASPGSGGPTRPYLPPSGELTAAGSFERLTARAPVAFAVTRGPSHTLVFANAAFGRLTGATAEIALGRPIADVLAGQATVDIVGLLDRTWRGQAPAQADLIPMLQSGSLPLSLTAWPVLDEARQTEHLVVEVRETSQAELSLVVQREIAERMLLSALRERAAAESAEAARRRFSLLSDAGRRLAESLDEATTLCVVAGLALPSRGAWCIVDLLRPDDTMSRVAIVHVDPAKQALVRGLEMRWSPEIGDPFGLPAVLQNVQPVIVPNVEVALAESAHTPEVLEILHQLHVGPLLTVPLLAAGRLLGAITFVGAQSDPPVSSEDTELARDLAARSAMALDRAHLYGQAVLLSAQAEAASQAKTAFLGTMGHELRTPLNAIGGFIDLIQMGLRGSVTEQQHADLDRMKKNQRRLLGLIEEVLSLVRVGSDRLQYRLNDLHVLDVVTETVALVEPLFAANGVAYRGVRCDPALVVRADREKLEQILLNLVSNAVKFTPSGGTIAIECEGAGDTAVVRVIDTGIGIPGDRLEDIFEPFVQVRSDLARERDGAGLGLAISRDLARAMHGDLTAESLPGQGSRFTLMLPRASDRREARR